MAAIKLWRALAITLAMTFASVTGPAHAVDRARPIAPRPPMGFNNWARFQCLAQAPLDGRARDGYGFQDFMLDQGRALVATGLAAAGYTTVVVDDCWMERGPNGELHGIARWGSFKHPSAQPGFAYDLTGYFSALHGMGLKGGLYNTAGTTTCQGVAAGEEGHQAADARRFVAWGVDFLKLDNCGASDDALPALFVQMGQALATATAGGARPILFDESLPAQYAPTDPAKYRAMVVVRPLGQMWRIGPDIRITHIGPDGRSLYDPWSFNDAAQGYEEGVYQAFTDAVALSRYVAPGSWNDADQLLIGDDGLTPAEERSQMGLWSIMGAPLILSADVRALARDRGRSHAAASLAILENPRVIAVDQDALGAGGFRMLRDHSADDVGFDVVVKPLADGGLAVLVLNKGPMAADYALPLGRIGVAPTPCDLSVTDLWSGSARRLDASGELSARIGSHDNLMVRIAPAACLSWTPTGQIAAAQAEFAEPPTCLQAGAQGALTVESCSSSTSQQWRMNANGRVELSVGQLCLSTVHGGEAAACRADDAAQRFRYHRSGAIEGAGGVCLSVSTAKVGAGGLLGQQGAAARFVRCRPDAPEQAFSGPHRGPVDL